MLTTLLHEYTGILFTGTVAEVVDVRGRAQEVLFH
jgi:hypothetical protein